MKAPEPKEIEIQATIVEWLHRCVRCRVAAIPNGMRATLKAARRAKREGMSAGAPDLVVAFQHEGEPRTVWIEVKTKVGRLTEEQQRWREDLVAMGHDHLVARSLDDVIRWFGDD